MQYLMQYLNRSKTGVIEDILETNGGTPIKSDISAMRWAGHVNVI